MSPDLFAPDLSHYPAQKWSLTCNLGPLDYPAYPAFRSWPVVTHDAREDCEQISLWTSLLPRDRTELCFQRLPEILGGEYAPSVGIGEPFFDGRQKTAMLSKRSELVSGRVLRF